MRALAEFVMKDRRSAIIAVLLLGLVPMLNLLSPVIVGLTMLRKGWNDALAILVWALLPIGAYAYIGDVVPLILLLGVTLLAEHSQANDHRTWCCTRWYHGRGVSATRA